MNQIEIIRSYRKTISVEIKNDLRIVVRAPIRMNQAQIKKFITDKMAWIEEHLEIVKNRNKNAKVYQPFNDSEIKQLKKTATKEIPLRVQYFANLIGVKFQRITIKAQSTRWGSCSIKGNLNFNCLLMLCPETILNYVVIHELCHLKHMNHSKEFWKMVEKFCPNYKECRLWLKQNGREFIKRLK